MPDFTYWTGQAEVQKQASSPLSGVKSIFLIGLAAAALAFSLMIGIYALYYIFSDFITSGETLALLTEKKLLGRLDKKDAKKGKATPAMSCNKRAVVNLVKALEQKKAMVLIPADVRSNIVPAIRKLSGSLGDDVRVVFADENDDEASVLAGLEDGKPCLIVAPSIIHSQLSGILAARVGTVAVAAVSNASRLKDVLATQAWVDAAGAEMAGYLFIR